MNVAISTRTGLLCVCHDLHLMLIQSYSKAKQKGKRVFFIKTSSLMLM